MWKKASAVLVAALLGAGLAGCTADGPPTEPAAPISVFLTEDVTEQQKQAIEARLRAVPGATEVRFESREQAYQRFKELFKDRPEMLAQVNPESLPESLMLTVRDRAAFDRAAASPLRTELLALPGVDDVVLPGKPGDGAVSECVDALPPLQGVSPNEIWVVLTDGADEAQQQAILARLEAFPGVTGVVRETRTQATDGLRQRYGLNADELAELTKLRPDLLQSRLRVTLADAAAVTQVTGSDLDDDLCRTPWVERVLIPPR
ncbi:permease-like cell division protein FtsX [Plantactinospora sp. B5E13]|uniref:permease-like cell division protein FtsX n=1 Tax=Plantactinospora sp. B5E13 TaxID=3153758 RepID=UPI00325EECB8